jgi:hypothetical protein
MCSDGLLIGYKVACEFESHPLHQRVRISGADSRTMQKLPPLRERCAGLTPSKYPTDRLVSAAKEGRHEASTVIRGAMDRSQ